MDYLEMFHFAQEMWFPDLELLSDVLPHKMVLILREISITFT